MILGLGLLASYVFRSPLIFDNFDELAHGSTLTRLIDGRALFQANPILPVSPFYPGIELVTIVTRWLTGLPLLVDQMVVLALARIVTVLCVFLIVERACHSSRAGGIGALVYAANPEFYSLGAQYGYQTLGLAALAGVILATAWIAFLGRVVTGYIGPIVQAGASSFSAMLGQLHGDRKLFQNSAGGGTQYWDAALILAAAVLFCLIILNQPDNRQRPAHVTSRR